MVNAPIVDTAPSAACVWSDALSVGVPEIDSDHKVLIDLIGQLESAQHGTEVQSVVGTVVAALIDYTEYHFEREERMQAAVGYAAIDAHKAGHEALKAQVLDFAVRYSDDPDDFDMYELFAFLRHWLFEHIDHEDRLYMSVCAGNPKAREAVASLGVEFFLEADCGSVG